MKSLLGVLQSPVLPDPVPLARRVVHLEVRLDLHGEVRPVLLQHVLLVLGQLDRHDVACNGGRKERSKVIQYFNGGYTMRPKQEGSLEKMPKGHL